MPVLLIGYGNALRRDDGAGPAVAERFAEHSGVEVWTCQQLTPELADKLVQFERTIFVDAVLGDGIPEIRALSPVRNPTSLGHVGDPGWLLELAEMVHGRRPEAWLVTIPISDLGFGEGLSADGQRQVEEAVRLIDAFMRFGSTTFPPAAC